MTLFSGYFFLRIVNQKCVRVSPSPPMKMTILELKDGFKQSLPYQVSTSYLFWCASSPPPPSQHTYISGLLQFIQIIGNFQEWEAKALVCFLLQCFRMGVTCTLLALPSLLLISEVHSTWLNIMSQWKMTGGTPEVRSDKSVTLMTFNIRHSTNGPMDQRTNGLRNQWTNGPMD